MEQASPSHIHIGLSGWGDHDDLYEAGTKAGEKLAVYARHFDILEMDNSFYAIPSRERMQKWSAQTPDTFGFIVKAYQGMTGHERGKHDYDDSRSMFTAFQNSVNVLKEEGKLRTVLFQYPPWFDCDKKNVDILKKTREWMQDYPVALEFRHQSWFAPEFREKTLDFMRSEGWIHSIADEPQAGTGSVPLVLQPTQEHAVMVRLHGRDPSGWHSSGKDNWRETRYLYRYSQEELEEWKAHVEQLLGSTKACWIIFNNNSGGDAAANAKQLQKLLRLPTGPAKLEQMQWNV
ncbi:DUF72 domain-containing protein [Paenibacillus sp. F411]|uniref:DUF72 domain-containing protein n=1 Tax=Paenibacillus sp. F411 TaxID=2820239 RepID=UPI001AAE2E84|nr:DUF72 domain-containing protein [Paenibacillus sp. F411]MBO2944202.1 DUF72 domain-containing protein [Paenibacillus sp. F411]